MRSPTKSPSDRSVPRKLALQVLTDVLSHRKPLDESIESVCARSGASGSARAWLTEISSGTLRNLRRLDSAIDAYSLKKKPTGKTRKILQIAVYQLLNQDRVFPATVVSETVDFVRAEEGEPPARFVNALLRKVAESRTEWRNPPAPSESASLSEKAAWASVPDEWWKRFERDYGHSGAKSIAEAALDRPETWFRLRSEADRPEFLVPGPIPGSARARDSGEISALPGYREGKWIVQDLASQILADRFVSELRKKGGAMKVLDRCAAPGGKSVAMSWLGAEVVATDVHEGRRKLLEETVSRAAPEVRVVPESEIGDSGPYSAVWVDAPCSGSGILRRHPDVRWSRPDFDLRPLRETQSRLLREALSIVPRGGLVFYSVCSLFSEEGSDVVRESTDLAEIREEIRLGPDRSPSCDGFFGAILEKR